MKKIKLKMKVQDCSQDFSHYKSMGIFPDAQGQLTLQSTVRSGQISNSVETMVVLLTCKNEEDPIKNRGARVFTTLYINFFRRARADNSGTGGGFWSKFELMQALMHVLRAARMRMIDSKMKELECSQDFSHYKSMGIFPDAQGQLTPESLVQSGRISKLSEMLWVSSLPISTKKIRS